MLTRKGTAWTAAESPEAVQVIIITLTKAEFLLPLTVLLLIVPCTILIAKTNPPLSSTSFLSEKFDIAPSRMRMFKLFTVLTGALHLSACFFWRVKVAVLCDLRSV